MLKQLDHAREKWGGKHSLIDRWLEDRQKLLITYCNMLHTDDDIQAHVLPSPDELNHFCEQLMDYISLGHFEVYESLVKDCDEHGDNSLALAGTIYPKINSTTDAALSFNEKYAKINEDDDFPALEQDLSNIGESIANRIELEDNLIDTLHKNH